MHGRPDHAIGRHRAGVRDGDQRFGIGAGRRRIAGQLDRGRRTAIDHRFGRVGKQDDVIAGAGGVADPERLRARNEGRAFGQPAERAGDRVHAVVLDDDVLRAGADVGAGVDAQRGAAERDGAVDGQLIVIGPRRRAVNVQGQRVVVIELQVAVDDDLRRTCAR